jgi:hypothetical protein
VAGEVQIAGGDASPTWSRHVQKYYARLDKIVPDEAKISLVIMNALHKQL